MADNTDTIQSLYERCIQRVAAGSVAKIFDGVAGYLRVRARERGELRWEAANIETDLTRWRQNAKDQDEPLDSPILRGCLNRSVDAYRKMLIYRPDWAEEFWLILRSGLTDKLDAIDALAGLGGNTEES